MTVNFCRSCGHRMRPNGTKVADYPGTLRHDGNGACTTCNNRARRDRKRGQVPDVPTFDVQFARYALESFMNNLPSRKART